MKYANVKICALIAVFGVMMSFPSCNKSKDPGPAVVKFSVAQATYNEDQGTVNIDVTLSNKQAKSVTLDYTWSGTSTTYLNGDFSLVSTTPITIAAGETVGHIQLQVIDDTQIDANDVVTLTLSGTSTNAKLSTTPADLSFALTITNNDSDPANTMQADLTWSTGTGADIDLANLDLALQSGVVITNGIITDNGTTLSSSNNTTGFETLLVNSSAPDQEYYIAVPYINGTSAVNFTLVLNGFGNNNNTGHSTFSASDSGTAAIFFGPFAKLGQTFGKNMSLTPKLDKVFSYKVDNFVKHNN